jgi:hypothetical protein
VLRSRGAICKTALTSRSREAFSISFASSPREAVDLIMQTAPINFIQKRTLTDTQSATGRPSPLRPLVGASRHHDGSQVWIRFSRLEGWRSRLTIRLLREDIFRQTISARRD